MQRARRFFLRCALLPVLGATLPAVADEHPAGPALDLRISHYSRILTREGVLREARYEESMLRRPGHVWNARVLPAHAGQADEGGHPHREFNAVTTPRHVRLESGRLKLEFVQLQERERISILPAEYETVGFSGSYAQAWSLVDPAVVARLPRSERASAVAGARWHEQQREGIYQRVLWDEQRQLMLVLESGDMAGTWTQRIEVKVLPSLATELPWMKLEGFAWREYADYLD